MLIMKVLNISFRTLRERRAPPRRFTPDNSDSDDDFELPSKNKRPKASDNG